MNGCMATDKPLISILMAVYEPRLDWLREQLLSLEAQTYPNLRLYVCDDCSQTVAHKRIQSCIQDCISAFPYKIYRNETNLGSNATFERLTQEADGDYFAYCDQDDVWLSEKLDVLADSIQKERALLACSDMQVIDGAGKQLADSITKVRRHHIFHSGEGLAEGLLFHNFVTGCTMLVNAKAAKNAVPFCPYMVHDHYLALWCSERGSLLSLSYPLVRLRFHSDNQTALMAGVIDKSSYLSIRIEVVRQRLLWLQAQFPCSWKVKETIDCGVIWMDARYLNWVGPFKGKNIKQILQYSKFGKKAAIFEVFAAKMPKDLFCAIIGLARRNMI